MLLKKIILGIVLVTSFQIQAQQLSFVGLSKDEVQELMQEEYKKFTPDKSVVKQEFNYLKYVNGIQTITWIIYFSEKDICTSTKKVCDYAEYDFVINELNNSCEKISEGQWQYSVDGIDYLLTLEEQDWYFTVREREKNNKK